MVTFNINKPSREEQGFYTHIYIYIYISNTPDTETLNKTFPVWYSRSPVPCPRLRDRGRPAAVRVKAAGDGPRVPGMMSQFSIVGGEIIIFYFTLNH